MLKIRQKSHCTSSRNKILGQDRVARRNEIQVKCYFDLECHKCPSRMSHKLDLECLIYVNLKCHIDFGLKNVTDVYFECHIYVVSRSRMSQMSI
jgi:hypothetical protein